MIHYGTYDKLLFMTERTRRLLPAAILAIPVVLSSCGDGSNQSTETIPPPDTSCIQVDEKPVPDSVKMIELFRCGDQGTKNEYKDIRITDPVTKTITDIPSMAPNGNSGVFRGSLLLPEGGRVKINTAGYTIQSVTRNNLGRLAPASLSK